MTHIAEKASPNGLSAFHDITLKFESAIVTEQLEYSFDYGSAIKLTLSIFDV